jgi:hypothetical protein
MKITNKEVQNYINEISEPRKSDIFTLIELGKKLTHKEPALWGSIIGFGNLHYKYQTGHEGNMPLLGLASRKQAITLYLSFNLEQYPQLSKLGKHSIGKGCLYIKKLSDINMDVLESLISDTMKDTMKLSFITDNDSLGE